jgi:hypothetical protein
MNLGRLQNWDLFTAKTTSVKVLKIENSTRTWFCFLKNEPVPEGVAMSELSNNTKKTYLKISYDFSFKNDRNTTQTLKQTVHEYLFW